MKPGPLAQASWSWLVVAAVALPCAACSEQVIVPRRATLAQTDAGATGSTTSPVVGTPAIPFGGTSTGAPPAPTTPRPGIGGPPPVAPNTLTCPPIATPASPIPWVMPNPLHQPVCTAQEAAIVASCFLLGGQNCNALPQISPYCQACAVVPGNAARYGALIQFDPSRPAELNVSGCVGAVSGNASATGCGARLLAEEECEMAACNHCNTEPEYLACMRSAAATTCAPQAAAAACADGPLTVCVRGNSAVEQATHLIALFCMP